MQYARLGSTGLDVSVVALGTGPLGRSSDPVPEAEAVRLVNEAVEAGINLIDTAPVYGRAEYLLGRALTPAKRDKVILATKAGRYSISDFDYTPARIRRSVEDSLRLLNTEYVDVLQLHDIEYVDLNPVLTDSFAELVRLKEEGKCCFIGMTGYPIKTFSRVLAETDVDVILTYAKATLLDDSLTTELLPVARERGIGLINAAAVALGLLTPAKTALDPGHHAPVVVQEAAVRMVDLAATLGIDIAFLANQYSIQRSGAPTTVVGVSTLRHLESAVRAAESPLDDAVLERFLSLRPPLGQRQWQVGAPDNN